MISLKRILFATDFSECAGPARTMACELARRFEAELHLLHVVQDLAVQVPEFGMGLSFPGFVDHTGPQRQQRRDEVFQKLEDEAGQNPQDGYTVVTAVRFGAPFVEIIRYARESNIDLIVLGSHGRTGLAHVLMGSVAERVVRKAHCPVLTVRPSSTHTTSDPAPE